MIARKHVSSSLAALALIAASIGAPIPAFGFSLPGSVANLVPTAPVAVRETAAPAVLDKLADRPLPDEVIDQLGILVFRVMMTTSTPAKDPTHEDMLKRVMPRLTDEAKRGRYGAVASGYQWEAKIVEDRNADAYAFPGGKILVKSGIFDMTGQNEDMLAVVLSHEIVHALARHFAERFDKELKKAIALSYTGKQLADKGLDPAVAAGVMAAMGVAHEGAVIRPFTRDQESQADHEGLLLLARAGFDPGLAQTFWGLRPQYAHGHVPSLFNSHPSDEARIRQIQAWTPEARALLHPTVTSDGRPASAERANSKR